MSWPPQSHPSSSDSQPESDSGERFVAAFFVLSSFFWSGTASLIYQVVWERLLERLTGATLPAVSILLAGFMAGLSLGSFLSTRWRERPRHCFLAYGALELSIAIWGYLSLFLLSPATFNAIFHVGYAPRLIQEASTIGWQSLYQGWPVIARFSYALILMGLPATLMGATFPVVARCLTVALTVDKRAGEQNEQRAEDLLRGEREGAIESESESDSESESESESESDPVIAGENSGGDSPARENGPSGEGAPLLVLVDQATAEAHDTIVGDAYVVNLLGAALGACLAGFVLLPGQGLSHSIVYACAISLLVSTAMFIVHGYGLSRRAKAIVEPVSATLSSRQAGLAAAVAIVFLVGAVSMILEVSWTRLFCLILGSSTYSLSAVLLCVLLGLSIGTVLLHTFAWRFRDFKLTVAALLLTSAISVAASLLFIDRLPFLTVWLAQLGTTTAGHGFIASMIRRVALISLVVLPPSVTLGGVFPTTLRALWLETERRDASLGRLYAASAAGCLAGSLLGGCIFLPALGTVFKSGIESTLICCVLILTGAAALVVLLAKQPRIGSASASTTRVISITIATIPLFIVAAHPPWPVSLLSFGLANLTLPPEEALTALNAIADTSEARSRVNDSQILFYREGSNTTVTVSENRKANTISLANDGKVEAALPLAIDQPAWASDIDTHALLGQLPYVVARSNRPRLFVIGYGSGATSGAALSLPQTRELTVADIEPAVFAASRYFDAQNDHPLSPENLKAGRVKAIVADGRNLLSLTGEKFDVIISQPAEPWVNGSADLYTAEFFKTVKDSLSEGGVFCQWLQLYAIDSEYLGVLLRTFEHVFPRTYAVHLERQGEIVLLGLTPDMIAGQDRYENIANEKAGSGFTKGPEHSRLPAGGLSLGSMAERLALSSETGARLSNIFPSLASLLSCVIATPRTLQEVSTETANLSGDGQLNTDDNLLSEYELPKQLSAAENYIDRNLSLLERFSPQPADLIADRKLDGDQRARLAYEVALILAGISPKQHDTGFSEIEKPDKKQAVRARTFADYAVQLADTPASRLARSAVFYQCGLNQASEIDLAIAEAAHSAEPQALILQALCYLQRHQFSLSERLLKACLAKQPGNYEANLWLGKLMLWQDKLAQAEQCLKRAQEAKPRSSEAIALIGRCLLRSGNYKDSQALLAAVMAAAPNAFEPRLDLARALLQLGRDDQALNQIELAARLAPARSQPVEMVCAYYALHNNWELVRRNLDLLRRKAPERAGTSLIRLALSRSQGEADGGEVAKIARAIGMQTPIDQAVLRARLEALLK